MVQGLNEVDTSRIDLDQSCTPPLSLGFGGGTGAEKIKTVSLMRYREYSGRHTNGQGGEHKKKHSICPCEFAAFYGRTRTGVMNI